MLSVLNKDLNKCVFFKDGTSKRTFLTLAFLFEFLAWKLKYVYIYNQKHLVRVVVEIQIIKRLENRGTAVLCRFKNWSYFLIV